MKYDNRRSFQQHMRGLEALGTIRVGSEEYDGRYLAQLVSVRYDPPAEAADNTPQIVCELGMIVARAKKLLDIAEMDYRIWRDSAIWDLMNNLEKAVAAGFESACDPGEDARGKPKPPKTPSRSDAEGYLRQLPDYKRLNQAVYDAQEAWSVLHTALEAAKLRTHALTLSSRWGLSSPEAASDNRRVSPGEGYDPDDNPTQRYGGLPAGSSTQAVPPPGSGDGPPPPPPPPPPPVPARRYRSPPQPMSRTPPPKPIPCRHRLKP